VWLRRRRILLRSSQDSRQPSRKAWPAAGLNIRSLREGGWEARPFRQFVLKLHGRCNLSCTYCYVYEMADQSWSQKPKVILPETVYRAAQRIAEHVIAHGLADVEVILHGGEPLLYGATFIDDVFYQLRNALPAETALSVRLQTNGTLLNIRTLDMMLDRDIKIGVSFDGTARSQDARRIYADGRGSHSQVTEGLRLLTTESYRQIFSGILCTIDVTSDPVATYESLIEFSPPLIDFLLPHANWSVPPPRANAVVYGEWLATAFNRWYAGGSIPETRVRLFEEIIHLLLGGQSGTEAIGLSPVALIVIDTDGSIEQVDTLKAAFPGAPETGMNVFTHSFDDALDHPSIIARQIGIAALSDGCRECPVHMICGGGYFPHRYRPGEGFRNPSVYCAGLRHLITHIGRRVRADLPELHGC
jgi:uncharacterized protein